MVVLAFAFTSFLTGSCLALVFVFCADAFNDKVMHKAAARVVMIVFMTLFFVCDSAVTRSVPHAAQAPASIANS